MKKLTRKQFITRLRRIQPTIKYVSGYKTTKSIVKVRDEYGAHKIKASLLLDGLIPNVDTAVFKITYFRKIAKAANSKYNYKKTRYSGLNEIVKVECPEHGIFTVQAKALIAGAGCMKCQMPPKKKSTGYSKGDFITKADNRECTLYAIKCYNDNETFYKIGITSRSVTQRFSYEGSMPYNYNIVHEIKGTAEEVWNLEKHLHKIHKDLKYRPQKYFSGITECFSELMMKHNKRNLWKKSNAKKGFTFDNLGSV